MAHVERFTISEVRVDELGGENAVRLGISRIDVSGREIGFSLTSGHTDGEYAYVPRASYSTGFNRLPGAEDHISGITQKQEIKIPLRGHRPE